MPVRSSARWSGLTAFAGGEWIALPFAIGCGFAGGGLREICPKQAIWHFSPLFFTDLHRYVWRLVRRFEIDWVVILLAAPIGLEIIQQALGYRFGVGRLFYHAPPNAWMHALIILATVLCVAIPIKIWNSARIEHRLQEQEKLLMAARVEALASQINPHFLFNTLTSILSLIRSQPETARVLIVKLSGLLRRLLSSQDHFVTLREELEAIDEYLDIEQMRFGTKLLIEKQIDADTLDIVVPSMLLQPIVENSIKHGIEPKVGHGHIIIRSVRKDGHAIIDVIDDGVGVSARDGNAGQRQRHRPEERERAAGGDLRCELSVAARQRPRGGHVCACRHPGTRGALEDYGLMAGDAPEALRIVVVDDERLAREELCYLLGQVGGVDVVAQAADGLDALEAIKNTGPDLVLLDVQMPGLTGFEVARRLLENGADTHIVFVTAFDRHAIEAFEVDAVDYLLKPVEVDRLGTAVDRVRRRIHTDRPSAVPATAELERLLQRLAEQQHRREQLAIKVADRFLLVHSDDLVHASVEDDVITVVTNSLSGTSNYRTLDELQARLDPAVFWRVHRSHLVNINKIKEIVPWFSRNFLLRMKDAKGTEIPVSRSQTKRLREYLKI